MRIAAISDLHLGARSSYLILDSVRARLLKELRANESDLDCLFIVGDLMDLTVGRYPEPWVATKEFFVWLDQALPCLKRIIYLPGNHDHHVWTLLTEYKELLQQLPSLRRNMWEPSLDSPLTGNHYGYHTPLHYLFPPRLQRTVGFSYPFHHFVDKATNTRFVFHHGHYFDPTITPLASFGARRYNDLRKIEALNLPYVESLFYLFSWDPLIQRAELGYYNKLLGVRMWPPFRWFWGHEPDHGACILGRSKLKKIEAIMEAAGLRDQHLADQDVWVFGHTHKCGSWSQNGDKKLRIFDLGGWVLNHDPRKRMKNACSVPAVFHWSDSTGPALKEVPLDGEELQTLCARAFPLGG